MEQWRLSAIKSCETVVSNWKASSPDAIQFKISSSQDFSDCTQAFLHNQQVVNDFKNLHHWEGNGSPSEKEQAICAVGLTMELSDRRFGEFTLVDLQQKWNSIGRSGYQSLEARGSLSNATVAAFCQ